MFNSCQQVGAAVLKRLVNKKPFSKHRIFDSPSQISSLSSAHEPKKFLPCSENEVNVSRIHCNNKRLKINMHLALPQNLTEKLRLNVELTVLHGIGTVIRKQCLFLYCRYDTIDNFSKKRRCVKFSAIRCFFSLIPNSFVKPSEHL